MARNSVTAWREQTSLKLDGSSARVRPKMVSVNPEKDSQMRKFFFRLTNEL